MAERERVDADVGGEVRHVGVDVERAVGVGDAVDAGRREAVDQRVAVDAVARDVTVELVGRVERAERGDLRHVGSADVEVLLQPLDRPGEIVGHDDPADPPAGHREVLREAVDHDRPLGHAEHVGCRSVVRDAVVDLVGDETHAALVAVAHELCEHASIEHGAGRVRRGGDDEPVERPGGVEHLGRRRPAGLGSDDDRHRLHAERDQAVAVARVAGLDDGDPGVAPERGEEREREAGRRARHDQHARRVDVDVVQIAVALGETASERFQPGSIRVAERSIERGPDGSDRRCGRASRGLADLEVDHLEPAGGAALGGEVHRHRVEQRRHRWALRHGPTVTRQCRIRQLRGRCVISVARRLVRCATGSPRS